MNDHTLESHRALALAAATNALLKSRPGAGGTIGTTRSGKSIYPIWHGTEGFTRQDHVDAAEAHMKVAAHAQECLRAAPRGGDWKTHVESHRLHSALAQRHNEAAGT